MTGAGRKEPGAMAPGQGMGGWGGGALVGRTTEGKVGRAGPGCFSCEQTVLGKHHPTLYAAAWETEAP